MVEAGTASDAWELLTEVHGTGGPVTIDLLIRREVTAFRIREIFGTHASDHTVKPPALHILRVDDNGLRIRLAWNTHPQEIYQLNEILDDGSESPVFAIAGNGAATWFDLQPENDGRIFQIRSIKN